MSTCHDTFQFRFCPVCGNTLRSVLLKTTEPKRLICGHCDFIFYLDPKVVACTVVKIDGRLLLLRRGIAPAKGKWVIPGGYVDRGESVESAAVRETLEECGLTVRITALLGVYSYTGRTPVVIVYKAERLSGLPTAGDETVEVGLFDRTEIPWHDLAFEATVDAIEDYFGLTALRGPVEDRQGPKPVQECGKK